MRQLDSILANALGLTDSEGARLAEGLESDRVDDSEEEWWGEITRRIERLRQGTLRTVSAENALAAARARLTRLASPCPSNKR